MSRRASILLALLVTALAAAACIPIPTAPAAPLTPAPTPQPLTLGMGYIPSVQFTPFYVAQQKGYFADEGLDVGFTYGAETDFIQLVATGEMPFLVGSGEQVILARAQGLPVTYVMRWYNHFPVVVFAPKEAWMADPARLIGHTVGIPGLYGASYIAWKALVYVTGLNEQALTLESIGFTQAEAVTTGKVDAAVDYITNGPVQLRLAGQEVDIIAISDYIDLPANGLITGEKVIRENPALVQKVVRAALRGLQDTLDDPDGAFRIALEMVPTAGGEAEPVNRAIFDASLELWRQEAPVGASDPAIWEAAARFMRDTGLIETDVNVADLFTNAFIPGAE